MNQQNIITDATSFTKPELQTNAQNLVTGCAPSNTNFTFSGTSYGDLSNRTGKWISTNSAAEVSGDHVQVQEAKDLSILVEASYKEIAEQVNTQSNHNLAMLKSSGGILTSEGGTLGVLKQAVITGITSTIAGEVVISLITMEQSVGTIISWKDLTAGTAMEHEFFAQKKNILLDGLISTHQYEITAAHKGVVRKVVPSNPVKITVQ